MRKLTLLCALISLLLMASDSFAQFNRKSIKKNNKRIASYTGKKPFGRQNVYTAVGISLNALNYYGDLSPLPSRFSTDISFTKPAIGISLFHRFGPRYTLIGQFMYGTLSGSDAESAKKASNESVNFREIRNLSFRNRIQELSVTAVFDLFENEGSYISRVKWTPYVFAGIAVFHHNPQAQEPAKFLDGSPNPDAGKWVDLQSLGTEGQNSGTSTLQPGDINYGIKTYSLIQAAIPFGVGARFRINEVFDIWADIGFRYTFTDYLDDVSRNYVDVSRFKSPLAAAMSYRSNELPANVLAQFQASQGTVPGMVIAPDGTMKPVQGGLIRGFGEENKWNNRGNSRNNDIYMVTSVKLTYILGATFHRAKFR
ncbi:MAG: hypothetical protein JST43_11505 [Bacteroidetes bacterium]|nr:hypothetical protein [Bacteroidota bacterium]MBS1539132.1 hypothetical protein [Bacteroidota bacterium]